MVGSPGVEPDSLGFQASAMAALAHFPFSCWGNLVGREGFEPSTFRLKTGAVPLGVTLKKFGAYEGI